MAGIWATAAEVKTAIADTLKRVEADLPASVTRIVAASIETAQEDMRTVLYGRGFTEAQLLTWTGLHHYHRHQSMYWCEVELRESFKDVEGELLKRKDRVGELAELVLFDDGGGLILPLNPFQGGITFGNFADRDAFNTRRANEKFWRGDWCGSGVLGDRR